MADTSVESKTEKKSSDPTVIETPPILKQKSSPQQKIVRTLLTLIMLFLIFYVLFSQMSSVDDVGDALRNVTAKDYIALFLIAMAIEITKAAPSSILVEPLTLAKAFISNEASGTISNTIPGPSGTTMRYLIYRSWGISAAEFGRSTVVNSIVNNTIQLVFPVVSVVLVASQQNVPSSVWWISGISAVLAIIALVLMILIARSERVALYIGHKLARWYAWFRGLRRKPVETDVLGAIVKFRVETLVILGQKWKSLFSVLIGKYFITFLCFYVSLRAVGLNENILTVVEIFAAYALARVLTIVEITPGGVGVNEIIYVAILEAMVGSQYDSQIVAGVLLYRAFTYLLPILLGAICYVFWSTRTSWRVDRPSRNVISVA